MKLKKFYHKREPKVRHKPARTEIRIITGRVLTERTATTGDHGGELPEKSSRKDEGARRKENLFFDQLQSRGIECNLG